MDQPIKTKSFWKRPEGVTGAIFLAAIVGAVGFGIAALPWGIIVANTIYLAATLMVVAAIVYMVLDPKMRNLIWYMYKSVMRWVTGLFVQIDPIGILKSYVQDLENNLRKMDRQISQLRGQMHKLKEVIFNNQKQIESNLQLAGRARDTNKEAQMILKTRKAGRLRDSNLKLEDLYRKMEVLYRVLTKMYENSAILAEDVKDQVAVKEQERKAIHASHGAMRSAMNVINGDKDKRYMFDQALEAIAEDVSNKVGEMERFMDMSSNFMESVDLQNGIFEEEGLAMLEKWEKEGVSKILGNDEKTTLLLDAYNDNNVLDINEAPPTREKIVQQPHRNQYDNLFE